MASPDRDRVRAVHPLRRQRTLLGRLLAATVLRESGDQPDPGLRTLLGRLLAATVLLLAGCGTGTDSGDEPPLQTTPVAASTSEEATATTPGTDPPTASTTEATTDHRGSHSFDHGSTIDDRASHSLDHGSCNNDRGSRSHHDRSNRDIVDDHLRAANPDDHGTRRPPSGGVHRRRTSPTRPATCDRTRRRRPGLSALHHLRVHPSRPLRGQTSSNSTCSSPRTAPLIVQHDDTVDRTTEASGRVWPI